MERKTLSLLNRKRNIVILAFAAFLLAGLSYAYATTLNPSVPASTSTSNQSSGHTLTVSGAGTGSVSPDQAQIDFGVSVQASSARAAANQSAKIVNNIISQLQNIGISRDNIITVYYNVYPSYDYYTQPQAQPTINGYTATYELQVTVRNPDLNQLSNLAGQVIDTAVSAGANQVSGVQFTVSNQLMKQLINQTLQSAIENASSKANAIAGALGVRIAGVFSATEMQSYHTPIYYGLAVPMSTGAKTQILPANFTYTDTVQVVYTLQ